MLASQQTPLQVTAQTVGEVGRRTEHAPGPGGFVIPHDAVARNVADQHTAAVAEPDRPFGPPHTAAQQLHRAAENAVLRKRRVQHLDARIGIALAGFKDKSRTGCGGRGQQGLFGHAADGNGDLKRRRRLSPEFRQSTD